MAYAHLVKPGDRVKLADIDAGDRGGLDKDQGLLKLEKLAAEIEELQELMFAARQTALLCVFQGRDTSGKDGAINRILSYINVQSTNVAYFKQPTPEELSHDFLWRVHPHTPGLGGITLFNRSHYEDVIVVRVHDIVPKQTWHRRYDQINAFEELIASSNTLIVKFYLHITKDEQEQRLLAREKDPRKAWKLSVGDWQERELWDDYSEAYEDAISKCSTDAAPWRVVPANHKWFRDLAIAETLAETLGPLKKTWLGHLEQEGKVAEEALKTYRAKRRASKDSPQAA